ncbi:hypothetical protein [Cellvibrio polysaccharolyticus]|uniref:Uncharacterized protein n=1 Tax=Cellvibrio polysaccharolyticus TaxID=2082724 RepID=A0A928YT09_9GAMM|nr:hypothetical protein [Cellvibrio polysaccharolyticus]MBE8716322.1 hypothetical protein [Cellvibrio polysaccharolyticus]
MLIKLADSFNLLPVEMNKVSGTHLLWRNRSTNGDVSDDEFVDNYSWVVKGSTFSDTLNSYPNSTRMMFAERYGGFGVGTNGGGARVVNINNAQIKGVGANALAGDGALKSHSYGGLDIQGAVKEVIYSRLLNKISPIGVQNIHGLIFLDETSALHNNSNAPSVLMVRESIARPSHFLPCMYFRLKPEHRALMRSDYSRIFSIYKNIRENNLLSEFYSMIQNFLERCADQLSFFRMARFSHNALTPSNISMDGRVLDTSLCSFVISGSNYGQVTSYFEEPATPAQVIKEWFYLINKFLFDKPVEEHFLMLYEEKFYQYAHVNMGYMFGLDREMSTKLSCTVEWRRVSTRLLSLLSMGSPIKIGTLPTDDSIDFVNDILTASLYSILNNLKIDKANKFLSEFILDLDLLMTLLSSSLGWHGQNEHVFHKVFVIQTIKRAILSSYFFITYIGRTVDEFCADGRVEDTEKVIIQNDRIADWIYENLLSERCTLYSGNGISIEYDRVSDEYLYCDKAGIVKHINSSRHLRQIIDSNKSDCIVQGYNFHPYLKRLVALMDGDAENSFNGVKNVFC